MQHFSIKLETLREDLGETQFRFSQTFFRLPMINLFINSDAILIVMHCGLSRVKDTIYKPLLLEEYTTQEKYCDKRFLSYNRDISIDFLLSILCHQFARMV